LAISKNPATVGEKLMLGTQKKKKKKNKKTERGKREKESKNLAEKGSLKMKKICQARATLLVYNIDTM